ncbi:uncharacterized protein LOC115338503 isoform X2 [Aquila chrysaetos chrysaetos]|uniref:uncharacterized protein LOC115338503 isoform X2 n=1 Tax=Aquila chrysaetos chrysaetos TaxID=223781 RepID=UPI00117662F6|nr:uncharacterized protein LOC115338503 isoform X2 [Aquila chrysaetos chrysaetos]
MQRCVAASHQPRCKEDEDVAWGSHVFDELQQPWDAALCCCEPSAAVQRGRGRCKCSRSCSSAGMQRCITASNQPWCSAVEDFGWGLHMFKELQQPWDVVLCCCKQSAVVQRGLCTGFARLTSCSSAGTQRCVTASDQPRCSNNEDVVQGLHVLEEPQQRWDAAWCCCEPSAAAQRGRGRCTCSRSCSSPGMQRCITASNQPRCSKNEDVAQGLHMLEELQQPWDANIMSLQAISCGAKRTRTLLVFNRLQQPWDAALRCCKPSAIVQRVQGHRTGCCTCWRSRSSAGMRHCLTASDQLLCNKDIAQGLHLFKELQQPWDATSCHCK